MNDLYIDPHSTETIKASFDSVADLLFNKYLIQVNTAFFRLIDIEFYYFCESLHNDVYAHKHQLQGENGRWYIHPSGIDITIGGDGHFGGVLIRGLLDITPEKPEKEIHGPWKAQEAICENFHPVFSTHENTMKLISCGEELMPEMTNFESFYKTKRVNLNPTKRDGERFYFENFRYVIQPHRKHKNKTQLAKDMQSEGMEISEINRLLGSKFL